MYQMMLQIDHNELHLFIKVQEELTYMILYSLLIVDSQNCRITEKILLSNGDVNWQYRPIAMVSCLNKCKA